MPKNKNIVELIHKDLAYKLVGCFYAVYNGLGPGFKETVYHKALAIEFDLQKISYEEEKRLTIFYKDKKVGVYLPDFVVEDKIIVEIKALDFIPKLYDLQLYYYLKGTDYLLGYLVNFGTEKIDIRRRVYSKKISGN